MFLAEPVHFEKYRIPAMSRTPMVSSRTVPYCAAMTAMRASGVMTDVSPTVMVSTNCVSMSKELLDELDDSETCTIVNSAGSDGSGHKSLASAPKKVIEETKDLFCKGKTIVGDEGHSRNFDQD
jgi:hypothetical protein